MTSVLEQAAQLAAAGRPYVLATSVWRRAPSSSRVGAKALVLPDGTVYGWIGGSCAEPTLLAQARAALADGRPRLAFVGPAGDFDGALREGVVQVPMACESEGAFEVYLEPVLPPPHVVVVGRSPAADTLALLASALEWQVTVVDDEPRGPGRPAGLPVITLARLPSIADDNRCAVVVATQGHYDEPALRAALATSAGYIGLVASRKRTSGVLAMLESSGVDAAALQRVHGPAGLDLGSIEHTEIAVSVLAELVSIRAAGGLLPTVDAPAPAAVAVDPVCGMTVTVAGAHHVSRHDGATVYFCGAGCRAAFDADPSKYSAA